MCKGQGGTSNQTSSVSIPQGVLDKYNQVWNQGQTAASQPFQNYSGEFVAPVTGTTQGGISNITGAGSSLGTTYGNTVGAVNAGLLGSNAYYNNAGAGYGNAAGVAGNSMYAVNPSQIDPAAINQFMSPYIQGVVDPMTAWFNQQNALGQTNLKSNEISSGAFGGDRSDFAAAALTGQQNLAEAPQIAGLYNQGYSQALAAAQQQQGVNLGAGQANRQALQTGAQLEAGIAGGQANLGNAFGNTFLAGAAGYGGAGNQLFTNTMGQAQGQLGAGLIPQQTQQAQDTALYNQFLMQQAYPFQTTQFLGNLAMGMGPLQGSTTTQTAFQPQPFFSDDRLKEDVHEIGRTSHGLKIIRYRYKEDPHKLLRIGFLASDVEKKMPDAVQHHESGLRSVDYDRAARASGGGLVMPTNDNWREGYAEGGAQPGFDPGTMAAIVAAQQAMYPGAAGRPGIGGTGPRGMQLSQPSRSELMKAPLMELKQQQPELAQDIKAAEDLGKTGKDVGSLYDTGKDALVGSPAKGTVGSSGYVAPTGGLVGTGGSWDWNSGWLGQNTGAGVAAPAPLDLVPTDTGAWPQARGGRLKRAAGGGSASGFIPYDSGEGYVPVADYQPYARSPAGLTQPGRSSPGGSGGGGSSGLSGLSSLASLGKLGVQGAQGLAGLFGSGATGTDGLPTSGLGGLTGDAASSAAGTFGAVDAGAGAAGAAGGGADALAGLFALAKRGGRIGKDAGGSTHDNTWMKYPGEAIGGILGGIYGGPIGAIGGSKGGGDIGLMVGDAFGGNWSGVGGDFMSSVEGGLQQGLQGLQGPEAMLGGGGGGGGLIPGMGGGGGGGSPLSMLGLRRGGRAGYQDGGSPDEDTQVAEAPPTAGLVVPQRDNVVPIRNPERPAARERADKAEAAAREPSPDLDTSRMIQPSDIPSPTTAGVVPQMPAPGPLPGVVSSTTATPPAIPSGSGVNPNNIGNVRPWGQGNGFQQPPDFNSGVGLAVYNARTYPAKFNGGKPMSLLQIGAQWAPKGDGANDPAQWARNVAAVSGLPVDQPIDLNDPKIAAQFAQGVHGAEHGRGAVQPLEAYAAGVGMANDPAIARGFGGAGGAHAAALNAQNTLPGAAIGPGAGMPQTAGVVPQPDWWDRNEKYIIPALSFLGNMLASPSRTLAGSIGSGMVGAAKALPQQQEIGQGQQRIDIMQRAQYMSLWAQLRQMWGASVTAANPNGDPALRAQMDRLAVLVGQSGGAAGGPAAPGSPNLPTGGGTPGLVPTATQPGGAGAAPAGVPPVAPVTASPLPPPPTMPPVVQPTPPATAGAEPNEASLPSVQRAKPEYTPEFLAQLAPNANPVALREQARTLAAAGNPGANAKYAEADAVEKQIQTSGQGVGVNGPVTAPNAEALQQSQNRVKENAEWQKANAPIAQQRQITRDNLQHVVKTLETFEPGALAQVKSDLSAMAAGVLGIKPPTTSTMNPAEYEKFLKAIAAVQSSAVGVDHGTDMARATLNAALAHPGQQPEAVRANLATALGQLDYSDELYKDQVDKMQRYPWLNQGLRLGEFTKAHPVEKYVSDHEANMAVRGATPDKPDELKPGQAYIVEPSQAKAWNLPGIDKPTKLRFKKRNPDGTVTFGRP